MNVQQVSITDYPSVKQIHHLQPIHSFDIRFLTIGTCFLAATILTTLVFYFIFSLVTT